MYFAEAALQHLHARLSLTIQELPFLAGTVMVHDLSTGILKATYRDPPCSDQGDIILEASHASATDSRYNYETIRAAGFPPAMLPASAFCPIGLKNHPGLDDAYAHKRDSATATKGVPVPVMRAQATFIPGGLVLSVYTHHSVIDGAGSDTICRIWASGDNGEKGNCTDRSSANGEVIDPSASRRAIDAMTALSTSNAPPQCRELTTLDKRRAVAPLRPEPYSVVARIISLSASVISRVRSELQAQTPTRISTVVALMSLLWSPARRHSP